jgi:hypothetical protein
MKARMLKTRKRLTTYRLCMGLCTGLALLQLVMTFFVMGHHGKHHHGPPHHEEDSHKQGDHEPHHRGGDGHPAIVMAAIKAVKESRHWPEQHGKEGGHDHHGHHEGQCHHHDGKSHDNQSQGEGMYLHKIMDNNTCKESFWSKEHVNGAIKYGKRIPGRCHTAGYGAFKETKKECCPIYKK